MRKNAAPETKVHNFHTGMLYFTGEVCYTSSI